jgi:hypothetical protein
MSEPILNKILAKEAADRVIQIQNNAKNTAISKYYWDAAQLQRYPNSQVIFAQNDYGLLLQNLDGQTELDEATNRLLAIRCLNEIVDQNQSKTIIEHFPTEYLATFLAFWPDMKTEI